MTKKSKKKQSSSVASSKKPRINGAKKGKQFERDLAINIRHIFPEAERMMEYQASSVVGVDLQGTDVLRFQCKNHANYCSVGTIKEIQIQHEEEIPILVTKGIRMEPMAVMPLRKLVTLLEVVYGLQDQWEVPEEKSMKSINFVQEQVERLDTGERHPTLLELPTTIIEKPMDIEEANEKTVKLSTFF